MSKVILLDSGPLMFQSIFNYERQLMDATKRGDTRFILPPTHTYFNKYLSALKKIGVDKDDLVIIALEGKSWRKELYAPYKAQRQAQRDAHTLIDFDEQFSKFNKLHDQLEYSTNWHFVRLWDGAEADDIISVATRVYKDRPCIIVSTDGDLKQLTFYKNVLFFSITKKCKGSKGMYEFVQNPLKIIADKAKKGDISDNIIPEPNEDENDIELRRQLVNLLELPEKVESSITEVLKNLQSKTEIKQEALPFQNSLAQRFFDIYKKDHILTPEYCYALSEKRVVTKKKKQTLQRKTKKEKENEGNS